MILTVRHRTVYRYDRPVRGAVQSQRLWPSQFDGQRVRRWAVEVPGGIRGGSFRDGAGDLVQAWSVRGPVTEITVVAEGEVETQDLAGVLRGHREAVPPEAYLRETAATRADRRLTELAGDAAPAAADPLEAAHALAAAVAGAIAWRPGATEAHTSAAEALALGEGVCQDHAHVLVAAARVRGLPARYVSGYLAAARGEVAPAAHAWAEVHIAGLGWVGFDAANRRCPDAGYIRLASGLDARGAAPVRGIARGGGGERLEVSVSVHAGPGER